MNEVVQFFKVLSDKNRLRILKLLEGRPLCVCELAFVLGITQPSVSRHLKKLKTAGLVAEEQDSLWTNYVFKRPSNARMRLWLRDLNVLLNKDIQIRKDRVVLKKTSRTQLCCR